MNGFFGTGVAFPFAPSTNGGLDYLGGPSKVEQAILAILETEPGERIMRPTFGCGLRRYIMQPNTPATRAVIRRDVEQALTDWEPRIQLTDVSVDPGDDPALVLISIRYVHLRTRAPGNVLYPFYLK
jgi:phage baseplate assembly protein W